MFRKSETALQQLRHLTAIHFIVFSYHPPGSPSLASMGFFRIAAFHGLHFDDVVVHQTLHLIHCRTRHDVGLGILWCEIFPLGFIRVDPPWHSTTKDLNHVEILKKVVINHEQWKEYMQHNMILILYKHISLDNSKFTSNKKHNVTHLPI